MTVIQDGPETCEVAGGGGFVRLRVPVRVHRETRNTTLLSRYRVEGFEGRDTTWSWLSDYHASVAFRIPAMFLQERARITLEVFGANKRTGDETLWSRDYRAHWVNGQPVMEPIP